MNCPKFMEHFDQVSKTCVPQMKKHSNVIDRLSTILKIDLRSRPVQVYFAYDVFVSQVRTSYLITFEEDWAFKTDKGLIHFGLLLFY